MDLMAEFHLLQAEHVSSGTPTDSLSNVASISSTPPTTASPGSSSLTSDSDHHKLDAVQGRTNSMLDDSLLEAAIPLLEQANEQQKEKELDVTIQEVEARVEASTTDGQSEVVSTSSVVQATVAVENTTQHDAQHDALVHANDNNHQMPSARASSGRERRSRASMPVYNLAQLSSNSIRSGQGKRVAAGDKSRRTISGDTLVDEFTKANTPSNDTPGKAKKAVHDGIQALDLDWSIAGLNTPQGARTTKKTLTTLQGAQDSKAANPLRRVTRRSGVAPETITTKLSALGKRSRAAVSRLSRELLLLRDTNEYAHIDEGPVRYTVWSNGKYVDEEEVKAQKAAAALDGSPARKKQKVDETAAAEEEEANKADEKSTAEAPRAKKRRVKKWLDKGLYAGQVFPQDQTTGLTPLEKKELAQQPDLQLKGPPNKALPPPIFNGLRLLLAGRDFKMPFDICNPLPPYQPKPAQYRTITKNRFVGDAGAIWKKTPVVGDFASRCVCKPEDGCGEDCQNRIMLYECDETNCNVGKEHCTNRAFQDLQERTKKGGRYRVGVEVYKTADRGYGVRSNRCFEPNQIIMEYTGEIITEEECDRRMNEVYKNNECYYLMSFDQNMIIDATTGSIARFVNHSCDPNCRMIKWIVGGQPRMALFAGDNPIMSADELTYDYNFDPFSAKNVQKCLCGSPNCRGVLGPKPREVKPPKEKALAIAKKTMKTVKKMTAAAAAVAGAKRKWKDMVGNETDGTSKKKQKTVATEITPTKKTTQTKSTAKAAPPASGKRSLAPAADLKKAAKDTAKGAAMAVKNGLSKISLKVKTTKAKKILLAAAAASPTSSQASLLGSANKGTSASPKHGKKAGPQACVTKKNPLATMAAKRVFKTYGRMGLAASAKKKKKDEAKGNEKTSVALPSDSPSGLSTSSTRSTILAANSAGEKQATTPSRVRTPSWKLLEASTATNGKNGTGSGTGSGTAKDKKTGSGSVSPGKRTGSGRESLTPGKKPRGILKTKPPPTNKKVTIAKSPAQSVKSPKPKKGLELSHGASIRLVEADHAA